MAGLFTALISCASFCTVNGLADQPNDMQDAPPSTTVPAPAPTPTVNREEGQGTIPSQDFAGVHWGLGLGVSQLIDGRRVESATVVNNIVRVDYSTPVKARFLLELHQFWTPDFKFIRDSGDWGIGPFVAVEPSTDSVVSFAAIGIMVGVRRGENSNNSFNIGLGIGYDFRVPRLGNGIEADQPLPAGESNPPRLSHDDRPAILVMTSFDF